MVRFSVLAQLVKQSGQRCEIGKGAHESNGMRQSKRAFQSIKGFGFATLQIVSLERIPVGELGLPQCLELLRGSHELDHGTSALDFIKNVK